jgi:DNA-binding transcriptional MocR family regulator
MTSPAELARPDLDQARAAYDTFVAKGMKLDLTRGKPSAAQLDLASELLHLPGDQYRAADGTDTRNYQGLQGLKELREIFAPVLQVPVEQLVAFGNGSLELMHDTIVNALLNPMPGSPRRWVEEKRVAFIAPVPGYDRHYGVCERLGVDLVPVAMTDDGPDMDEVERLVAADPSIKGIWCVPKYSNPTGDVYSDETVRRLATMPTAAPDFRIMWDNAYAVHTLDDEPAAIADLLALATDAGNGDRVFVFGSTSKITLAGAGVAFFGASPANIAWWLAVTSKRTIGPDKTNHLRHAMFLRDTAGVAEHMRKHRAIIAPKFAALQRILNENFASTPGVSWSTPTGGYFVTLRVPDGCASEIVRLAKDAGIALTPAGATHPYGKDPDDAIIRLAPTFPVLDEVEKAMAGVAVCVKLALAQRS